MATGPQHYIEAERLQTARCPQTEAGWRERMANLADAQVHATLALAAAVGVSQPAVVDGETAMTIEDIDAWMVAASENRRHTGPRSAGGEG